MRDYTWQVQDEAAARQVSAAGMGRACPYCGSYDGMAQYCREAVRLMLDTEGYELSALYQLPTDSHNLYGACWHCNRHGARPLHPNYGEALGEAEMRKWLATPCECAGCRWTRGQGRE